MNAMNYIAFLSGCFHGEGATGSDGTLVRELSMSVNLVTLVCSKAEDRRSETSVWLREDTVRGLPGVSK